MIPYLMRWEIFITRHCRLRMNQHMGNQTSEYYSVYQGFTDEETSRFEAYL